MNDVVRLYRALPDDLRRHVKTFLALWEQCGMTRPPRLPKNNEHRYYHTIRQCPRGATWKRSYPESIYYRRQHHFFRWELTMDWSIQEHRVQFWVIKVRAHRDHQEDDVKTLLCRRPVFYESVPPAPFIALLRATTMTYYPFKFPKQTLLKLEFCVTRPSSTSAPTRQACAEAFVKHIKQLSMVAESAIRK